MGGKPSEMPHRRHIAVIGLGYVGLPVAVAFARSGVRVVGFDINPDRIAELRRELARRAANAQRAPTIHDGLDQNHPVRPRLQASAERKQP